jgi:hypothetical protein
MKTAGNTVNETVPEITDAESCDSLMGLYV